MTLKIISILFTSYSLVSYASSAITTSEAITAAETFRSTFGTPYHAAIHFLTYSVLKPLADAPVPENSSAAGPIVTSFSTNINIFVEKLQPLNSSSQIFRQKLDRLIENITVEHSRVEKEVVNMTKEVAKFNQKISSAQIQLNIAQREVDAANARLAGAERVLRDAEDRLDKGENCVIRKRRDIWGSIGRVFTHDIPRGVVHVAKQAETVVVRDIPHVVKQVVNAPCQIFINIGNLKNDRNGARDRKNNAVNHRQNVQQKYNDYVAARDRLSQQKQELVGRKDSLGVTLQQLNQEKVKAVTINVKIKQVIVHVSSLLDRGTSLREIVSRLIDVEALVNPLNSVSELVLAFTNSAVDVQKFNSLKSVISASVKSMQTKLPMYPIVLVNLKPKPV